nr:ABC-three component system middle component 2 [uncultured Acetatifactor sp.]
MNSVFNSEFELSLRILLTLYTSSRGLNADEIVLTDFITIYSHEFGLSADSLHGNNEFSFSELAARREQFNVALKGLVLNRYVNVTTDDNGFTYEASELGESVCDSMSTDYADTYIDNSYKAQEYLRNKSTTELFSYINRMALINYQEAR